MDAGAEALARRAQRFGKAPAAREEDEQVDEEARLAELIQLRAVERKEGEKNGILSTGKTRLDEAKDLVGNCPGMISEYQYYWRKLRYNNIHSLEKDENGNPQWYLTIKDYARSAAGNEQELPSDVRPPDVLLRTTDYLLVHILTTHPFNAVNQAFIRDRARAIVKDFTMQHVRNAPAIESHERIVRMAALSMHIFRDQRQPDGPFDHDGERKQFVNALSSLTQFYTDSRTPTLPKTFISPTHVSPHEPEFTAFWHLFSLRRPPAMPETSTNPDPDPTQYPQAILTHPLFRLARTFITLWSHSDTLISQAETMLLSPSERAAKEAREATRGVHRFKRPQEQTPTPTEAKGDEENWRPQRFDYPPGFAFPALALLRRLADPGVPWVLAAVLEASALDDVRARALWEIWQMRRGGDVSVAELVELLGCDEPEDVRILVDTIVEASGRAVRRLRPKGSDEIRAYRLVGSMKFPSHYPKVRRNTRLIDSKRPTHLQLADVVNQPWDQSTNGYELTVEDPPELVLPDRVDIEPTDAATAKPPPSHPGLSRNTSVLDSSRGNTPFGGTNGGAPFGGTNGGAPFGGTNGGAPFGGTNGGATFGGTNGGAANTNGGAGGVFAGFGAVDKGGAAPGTTKPNPFGSKPNPFGAPSGASPFGARPAAANPFGGATTANPFGGAATANPFGGAPLTTSSANPFGGASTAPAPASTSNPFGGKPATSTSGFGAGASAFGSGASAFGAGSTAFGGTTSAPPATSTTATFGAGSGAFSGFGTKSTTQAPPSPPKPKGSPTASKLSPFAASFVPKFAVPGAAPAAPPPPAPALAPSLPESSALGLVHAPPPVAPPEDNTAAAEAEAEARQAKLREKLEAAKKEEARIRAEEERKKAEERRKREEARRREEEANRRKAEAEETERRRAEAEEAELERQRAAAEARRRHLERLHSTTAQLLLGDILEILVVPEVQYAIEHEKRNRLLARKSFEWWKTRAAKRIKRRRVLENMGLGRVGVAGAAGEVGELFDEEDEEGDVNGVVVRERTRTTSFREARNDADLAAAMAKAAAERESLWAPGRFLDIIKTAVTNTAQDRGKSLDEISGWDVWLCTSGVNKSSAEWLRKKLNARPTQLVDGTVSIASVTPKEHKKESAPGLVVFECSSYLGAAMTEQEWSDAWSNEANRIARLFSAMSNHASYTPSLLFIIWSTEHVAQHSEVITRKIKKAASHLADVSIQGEPSVVVLVDETVETVFQDALASLELDVEGRPVVEQSSVADSLSRQISTWHRTLSDVLRKIPSFDDEDNATYIAQIISLFFKALNVMTTGVTRLAAPHLEDTIHLPEFSFNTVHDNKSLYNLADSYATSISFAEPVDLNVLRSALRQARHSSRPFPARFFSERVAQLVDIALTPSISGNRPRPAVAAAEREFEVALNEAVNALDARPRKRVQDNSPVRDTKKARLSPHALPSQENGHVNQEPTAETSGAAKLRALLAKTKNRWAESDGNES